MNRAEGYLDSTNRLVDSACAVAVILLTYTSHDRGRVPIGLAEVLGVPLTVRHVAIGLLLLMVWHSCFSICGLYQWAHRSRPVRHWLTLRVIAASTIGTLLIWSITAASGSETTLRLKVLFYAWCIALAAEGVGRGFVTLVLPAIRRQATEPRQAVIVGTGSRAARLWELLRSKPTERCQVLGFVDNIGDRTVAPEIADRMLSTLDGLEGLLSTQAIDQVLVALPVKSRYAEIQRVIDTCERLGVEVIYFPDIFSVSLARREYASDGDFPAVRLQLAPSDYRLIIKRVLDISAVVAGTLLLWPLFLLCAVAVKLSSPGPVLFSQLRYGHNRRVFRMYKFRTMVTGAEALQASLESQNEAHGPIFKIRADPRITRVGRIMRKLSLDELPQLINVLRGEMSLVGPRPMSTRDVARFSDSWLLRRFSVKPGLTCLWQVNGRSNTDFDRWVELDLKYIDNWSLSLDMRILIKTVPAVLSGDGAM